MGNATSEAVAGFAAWAATYDQTIAEEVERVLGMPYAEILQRVIEAADVTATAQVLDIGTGTGALAMALARQLTEGRVVGVDPTPEMLCGADENVRRAGLADRVELRRASAEALPFPDSCFDVVVSSIALHHTQVQLTLREIARVLKPGGHLALADTGRNARWESTLGVFLLPVLFLYFAFAKRSLAIVRAELAAYKQLFLPEEWQEMLREVGLRLIEVQEFAHPTSKWNPPMLIVRAVK